MDERSNSSISSELVSGSISSSVELLPVPSPQQDPSEEWDRGDEPSRKILQQIELSRAVRIANEAHSDLEQILNRVDQVL